MSPIAKIASRLRRRWDPSDAAVLSDWCEEHGLVGMARQLRRGASARSRELIHDLCRMVGCREAHSLGRLSLDEWIRA